MLPVAQVLLDDRLERCVGEQISRATQHCNYEDAEQEHEIHQNGKAAVARPQRLSEFVPAPYSGISILLRASNFFAHFANDLLTLSF
jgi:hypothetical protein